MKAFISKSKSKRLVTLSIVVVFLFQLILTSVVNISFPEDVHAEALSPKDTLLLKVLKAGFQRCIDSGILSRESITGSTISENILFNDLPVYTKDHTILLPFKYGSGNTVNDGDISCKQLFMGVGNGGSNSFNTFQALGGKKEITNGGPVAEKNSLIEALGYITEDRQDAQLYCAALNYTATEAVGTSKTRTTNSICVNVDVNGIIKPSQGNKITSRDIVTNNTTSDEYISLTIDPSYKKINVTMNLSKFIKDASSCLFTTTDIFTSENLDKYRDKTAESFFKKFFDDIESKQILNKAKSDGYYAGSIDTNGCKSKPFPSELGVSSVVTNGTSSKSSGGRNDANAGTELNNSLAKDYIYPGSYPPNRNYNNLMKYYLPSYPVPSENNESNGDSSSAAQNDVFSPLERAYNWYYALHDVFNAISIDESNGCSTSFPSNGYYIRYLKTSESDPSKTEVQYCLMNESVLNLKTNETLMDKSPDKGKINVAAKDVDKIVPLDAKQVLENLNSINLTELCAQDGSFPLCKSTPIDCKNDPSKEECKELAGNASETGEDGQNGEQAVCMQNAGALGWIICPLMYGIRDAANGLFEKAVTPLLRVHESVLTGLNSNSNSPMYQAWSFFRNVANIMFVIAMLFVIFSQITGFGIDNYGIKKILPKLIVTAIIVNFSYIICGIFVDLSNIFGEGIKNIFESVAGSTTATTEKLGENVAALINEVVGMIATVAAAGGAAALGLTAVNAVTSGSLLTIIFPILAFIGSALMAAFFAMLMLGLRQALIIIMIVVSPVAFVLYAIPNTNGLFKKWFQLFKTLLMLFPVFCFMVGGGFLVSNIIIKADSDIFMKIIGGLISIAPYFAVPSMTKNAMKGFDGAVAGLGTLQQKANNAGTSINKKITNSDAMKDSMQNAQIGKMQRYVDKYSDKDVSKLASWKKRRLSNAVGFLNKDGRKNAAVGAAMREYAYNNSQENVDRINAAEINALNDTVKSDLMSSYKSENLSNLDALKQLKDAQGYDYSTGTVEANRDNDNRIRALSSYLASTKEGQKALDQYMSGGYLKKDASGNIIESESVRMGDSSKRAMAVMGRNMVDNHANLRDKYQVAFDQFDNMRGSQKIEDMTSAADGQAVTNQTLSSGLNASLSNVAGRMDLDDLNKLGKQDFKKFYNTSGAPTFGATDSEFTKLQGLADARIKQLRSDTTLISGLSDEEKKFLSLYSTGNVDASTISNVLYMKDASGTVTGTIEQS